MKLLINSLGKKYSSNDESSRNSRDGASDVVFADIRLGVSENEITFLFKSLSVFVFPFIRTAKTSYFVCSHAESACFSYKSKYFPVEISSHEINHHIHKSRL